MAKTPDSLQGSLELLILKTVATTPQHGFGIALHIQTVSDGLLRVEKGSLYPALHRLQKQGFLKSEGRRRTTAAAPGITVLHPPAAKDWRKR